MLNEQALFDFKNIFMMPVCKDGKLIKGWDINASWEIVTNCTVFHGQYPNMFSTTISHHKSKNCIFPPYICTPLKTMSQKVSNL